MVDYITYLQINDNSNSQNKLDTYNTWYIVFTYLYITSQLNTLESMKYIHKNLVGYIIIHDKQYLHIYISQIDETIKLSTPST